MLTLAVQPVGRLLHSNHAVYCVEQLPICSASSMDFDSDIYLRVREKEGRLYSDDVVGRLPDLPGAHPLRTEWRARAASAARLCAYLAKLSRRLTILELGCGNGWLANRLARLQSCRVIGVDLNHFELSQAARVFAGNHRLMLLKADIFQAPFCERSFDTIVIASAIQYFADLPMLIQRLRPLLLERGEIHVLDSPLYAPSQVAEARARTQAYYTALGFPEMADHYHHHTLGALAEFHPTRLYDPCSPIARFWRLFRFVDSPFPWMRLRP
ncbi:MAG: class I SAM-dependent methyltransferase [Chloroflexi bacterium]|nr:class I SAM-dependent methyltransferase [Chloroflexota bacterium]